MPMTTSNCISSCTTYYDKTSLPQEMYKFSSELSLLRISWFYSSGCPLALNLALLHPALQRVWFLGLLAEQNLLASWEPHSCFLTRLCLQVVTSPLLLRYILTWHPLLTVFLPAGVAHCCTASVLGLSLHRGLLKVVLAPV